MLVFVSKCDDMKSLQQIENQSEKMQQQIVNQNNEKISGQQPEIKLTSQKVNSDQRNLKQRDQKHDINLNYQNLDEFSQSQKKPKKTQKKKRKLNLNDFAFLSIKKDALNRFRGIRKRVMAVRDINSPLYKDYLEHDVFYAIGQKTICRLQIQEEMIKEAIEELVHEHNSVEYDFSKKLQQKYDISIRVDKSLKPGSSKLIQMQEKIFQKFLIQAINKRNKLKLVLESLINLQKQISLKRSNKINEYMLKNAIAIAEKAAYLQQSGSKKKVKKNRIVDFVHELKVMGQQIEKEYKENQELAHMVEGYT